MPQDTSDTSTSCWCRGNRTSRDWTCCWRAWSCRASTPTAPSIGCASGFWWPTGTFWATHQQFWWCSHSCLRSFEVGSWRGQGCRTYIDPTGAISEQFDGNQLICSCGLRDIGDCIASNHHHRRHPSQQLPIHSQSCSTDYHNSPAPHLDQICPPPHSSAYYSQCPVSSSNCYSAIYDSRPHTHHHNSTCPANTDPAPYRNSCTLGSLNSSEWWSCEKRRSVRHFWRKPTTLFFKKSLKKFPQTCILPRRILLHERIHLLLLGMPGGRHAQSLHLVLVGGGRVGCSCGRGSAVHASAEVVLEGVLLIILPHHSWSLRIHFAIKK